jgi:hypothetical protein
VVSTAPPTTAVASWTGAAATAPTVLRHRPEAQSPPEANPKDAKLKTKTKAKNIFFMLFSKIIKIDS